jgi:dinuclear metal center YbgI/SA1388 family protein
VCAALETLAPLNAAESWDNVGLLAGDGDARVRRALLCIDLTPPVVAEAIAASCQLVIAYHPPIFKPIARLDGSGTGTDALLFRCIAHRVAIYSPHTALDCADGGTNDVLARLCGVTKPAPVSHVEPGQNPECKVVVFVPAAEVDGVAEAMFQAGAGRIGEYAKCSYRLAGQGTFLGSDQTRPAIGQAGRFECVDEIRLETVVCQAAVPAVIEAIRTSHSYEEPAFDIYPLQPHPAPGLGRQGRLAKPTTLATLARKLKRKLSTQAVQIVGEPDTTIERVICMVGAAGREVFKAGLGPGDAVVTGEIRHHHALTILRCRACAVALNHWTSERPVLASLADRLLERVPGIKATVSRADCEPFTYV